MADVVTAVYGFTLPEVGASDDTWGTKLNADLAKLEALLVARYGGGTGATLGTYWKASQAIQRAGAKNIILYNATAQQEGAWGIDGADGNIFIQKILASSGAAQARLRLEADGAISANVGFFKGSGVGLTGIPSSALDFTTPAPGYFSTVQVRNNSNSAFYMMRGDGTEKGVLYAGETLLAMRFRPAGATLAQMVFNDDGTIEWVGSHSGLVLENALGATPADVSKGLQLFTNYGFGVQGGRLNAVTNGQFYVVKASDGTTIAATDVLDAGTVGDETIITRIKGDARYRNASNLNAGTVAVARLPVDTTAEDWVAARLAGKTVNEVGSDAMLRTIGGSTAYNPNATLAGSSLYYAAASDHNSGTSPSGTWRCMGYLPPNGGDPGQRTTLWRRIA